MRISGPQSGPVTSPMTLQTPSPDAPAPTTTGAAAAPVPSPLAQPRVIDLIGGAQVELTPGDVPKIIDKMNETFRIFNHTMRFRVDDGKIHVKLIDVTSGEVVREIPPDKLLDTFRRVKDFIGLIVDERV